MNHLVVSSDVIRFAVFEVDLRTGELHKNGLRVPLQEQPFHVLAILLEHAGDVVFRDELRKAIWPENTFVDFDNSLNTAINKIREALGDSADHPRFVETIPRRGYRFIAAVTHDDMRARTPSIAQAEPNAVTPRFALRHRRRWLAAAAATLIALVTAGVWFLRPRPPILGDRDQILLADFVNNTGEPIFDGTLKTAVAVKIGESPYLNVVPDEKVRANLKLMAKSPDEKVVGEVARELCQRVNAKALLQSEIGRAGNAYLITLNTSGCRDGKLLARRQQTAASQTDVLKAVSAASSRMRTDLGESIRSIAGFDTPLEQATTGSLEALRAYTLGYESARQRQWAEACVQYRRAVELDPSFAMAWFRFANCSAEIGNAKAYEEYRTKAYELRERASERERLFIAGSYLTMSSHPAWDKAIAIWENYIRNYPADSVARLRLAANYATLGWYDQALTQLQEAAAIEPNRSDVYVGIGRTQRALNRFDDAKLSLQRSIVVARCRNVAPAPEAFAELYAIAVVQNDDAAKRRIIQQASQKEAETDVFAAQSRELATLGRLREAIEILHRSQAALRLRPHPVLTDLAILEINQEVQAGHFARARALIAARKFRPISEIGVAVQLATMGDIDAAEKVMARLERERPDDTNQPLRWFPLIRAKIALTRGKPADALAALRPGTPYENWSQAAAQMRGEAFLAAGEPDAAGEQFRFILNHRGIDPLAPYPRVYVWLARAYAAGGRRDEARQMYEKFFGIWKDADPDVPILRQAKAEYAKLR
jgi:DNA-binding winged helix-turn-helix (wHTH) protein/Tfp pilus assembly protein PilF